MNKYALKFGLALFIAMAFSFISSSKEVSAFTLNPNPRPNGIPAYHATMLEGCNGMPSDYSPSYQSWLSATNPWSSQSVVVAPGTTSVPLVNHWASAICSTPVVVPESRTRTLGAGVVSGGGSISGAVGNELWITNGGGVGDYRHAAYGFTYNSGTPITTSRTIVINFTHVGIGYITDGRGHTCIAGDERSNLGGWNFNLCQSYSYQLSINIIVNNQPPIGNIDIQNCAGGIQGWAFDPDNPNASIDVHIYMDYPAGHAWARGFPATANTARADVNQAFGISGNHGFSIDLSRFFDAYPHNIYVYAIDTGGGNNPQILYGGLAPPTWGPCAVPSCNNTLTLTPGMPQPGESFNALAGFNYTPGAEGWEVNWDMTLTLPGATPGSERQVGWSTSTGRFPPWVGVPPPSQRRNPAEFGGFTYPSAGRPAASWTVFNTATGTTLNCSSTGGYTVGDRSYLKAFGGEVRTGDCRSDPGEGGVHAWVRDDIGANYAGASAQLTVTSLLQVNEFYSASQGASPRPKGLTIANTGPGDPSSEYGGGSEMDGCITDYFTDTRDPDLGSSSWSGNVEQLNLNDGRIQYFNSGNLQIGASGNVTVPIGTQMAVFVEGNVFIRENITYATGAENWSQHPYLVIVASGDIRVHPDVTNLDGLFVAQAGTIYTCAQGINNDYSASAVYGACRNKLTVNGGLIADSIKFLRMNGTVRSATPEELPNSGNIAEVINYTPEMYLTPSPLSLPGEASGGGGVNPEAVGRYQSIKSLPPIY